MAFALAVNGQTRRVEAATGAPTGAGEPDAPPLAPALANAIRAATGKRVARRPMVADGVTFA
jgi:CO/xanthine dehydrogenase Mo-binding subunit